ncbi:MAG: sugar kinase [Deltaproteobacteria bacterium]|nr:sugar kinase [Deltaproteobacteria bacterium]
MTDLAKLTKKFSDIKIVVLGDLVVDKYIYGTTRRISREAPVLIVREEGRDIRLGAAGNVVANIRALGGKPLPVGLVGADDTGNELLDIMANRGISADGILIDPARFTTTKTRILAGGRNTVRQQMLRIDKLNKGKVDENIRLTLVEMLRRAVERASALVVSDYTEGVVTKEVFNEVVEITKAAKIPVFADARWGIERFKGVEALIPNEPELATSSGMDVNRAKGLENAGRWLLNESQARSVMVKRGNNGMALFMPDSETSMVPIYGSAEVADVTGAGDTVIASFSLARTAGAKPAEAMRIANTAGGIKVTKSGTAVVEVKELRRALRESE